MSNVTFYTPAEAAAWDAGRQAGAKEAFDTLLADVIKTGKNHMRDCGSGYPPEKRWYYKSGNEHRDSIAAFHQWEELHMYCSLYDGSLEKFLLDLIKLQKETK